MSRKDEIIDVARQLLESQGSEGLTMRAIAADLGIRAPSLYKHIAGKHELEIALITDGLSEQAEAFEMAADQVDDADRVVWAIATAYRAWALDHPHLYRLMNDRPLPRSEIPEGLEDQTAAPLLAALSEDIDRARAAWAFAHGMIMLELAKRFPPDADLTAAWAAGLAGFTAEMSPARANTDQRPQKGSQP